MKGRWRHARLLPIGVLARKVGGRLVSRVLTWGRARGDARNGTYLAGERVFVALQLPRVEPTEAEVTLLLALAQRYAAHEFDLLGSGWVRVPSPPSCHGLPGRASTRGLPPGCRAESARIRSYIEGPYEPIDWHLDFKSGYRWSERTWYLHVPYGHLPGVDVKVPWELARLQHVPVLLLAARVAEPGEGAQWRSEAVNQMLDFVAANPPRFGVNWRTAMDVGIRAANMALAMDLLAQDSVEGPWLGVLARSLEEHARHIVDNLEWSPTARGNHYLANIAGLAWCAAHLEASPRTDGWLAWATRELEVESGRQFLPDGSNFEASVCYHRLSAEIVAWTFACLIALPEGRRQASDPNLFPAGPPVRATPVSGVRRLQSRLAAMAEFTKWATKPGGRVAQIGDNDNGRFFRLPGEFEGIQEQPLRHDETVDVLGALCGRAPNTLAGKLARGMAGVADELEAPRPMASFGVTPPTPPRGAEASWTLGEGCWDGLEIAAFPDFGVFVWRSKRVWMAVRCGSVGQDGIGGHAHNDALHLELVVDGEEWIADPGTGVYTPDPELRNAYRSAAAHFVPRPQILGAESEVGSRSQDGRTTMDVREPASLSQGLFRLPDCGARCHRFGPEGFVGSHDGFGARMWRTLDVLPDGLRIRDVWEGGAIAPIPDVGPGRPWASIPFSSGYGSVGP